jgi:predicted TIM-barrel fold metal-dependent hydrolase
MFVSRVVQMAMLVACWGRMTLRAELPAVDGGPPVPVIDMHTHVFNARDLPMFGVLHSRREPVSVPAVVAKILKEVMIAWTPVDDLDDAMPEPNRLTRDELPAVSLRKKADASQRRLSDAERKDLAKFVKRPGLAQREGVAPLELDYNDFSLVALALAQANFPPGETEQDQPALQVDRLLLPGFLDLLDIMTDGNQRIAWRLINHEYPKADLFVHHMMDMEKGYGELPARLFDEQMQRMAKLNARFDGKLLHFVAFDPFRRQDALETVKRGVALGGVGVKFYPPTGYRAANNKRPNRPIFASAYRKARWDSRYKGLTNERLDAINEEFFQYCASNQVPIFTHCTPKGFEADKNYGRMADPSYWATVLARHPSLRLCFGHAGGEAYWFADSTKAVKKKTQAARAFGTNVVDLCLRYTNVFCEVGFLDPVLDPDQMELLRNRLGSVVNLPSPTGPWRFGDKIMYGTDWHMMHAVSGHREYLARFHELFATPELAMWHRKFFSGNAVVFLGLAGLGNDVRFPARDRQYWQQLVPRTTVNGQLPNK